METKPVFASSFRLQGFGCLLVRACVPVKGKETQANVLFYDI